jgi:hypothetical protein
MTHRLLAAIAVACLLGACSDGDSTPDGSPPEQSPITEPGETPALEEGRVPGSSTDSADSPSVASSGAADATAVASVAVEEPQKNTPDSETPPSDEFASEIESPPPVPAASSSGLRVLRAYVCKGIEQGEPTEAGKSFVPQDGVLRLCCFSEIAGAAGPDTVFHVWRWGDREMVRVALEVKSARWRTWSTKRILDEWRGEWHVDVTDREGSVLASLEFSVE